jgi:hypothetical protein
VQEQGRLALSLFLPANKKPANAGGFSSCSTNCPSTTSPSLGRTYAAGDRRIISGVNRSRQSEQCDSIPPSSLFR